MCICVICVYVYMCIRVYVYMCICVYTIDTKPTNRPPGGSHRTVQQQQPFQGASRLPRPPPTSGERRGEGGRGGGGGTGRGGEGGGGSQGL